MICYAIASQWQMILVGGTFKIGLAKYLHKPLNEYQKSHQYSHLFSRKTKTANFKCIYLLKASFGYLFISILGYSLPHGLQTTKILFCFHGIKNTRMQHIINDLAAILSHTKISKTNVLYHLKIAVMGYFVLVQAYILVCKSNSKQTDKLLSGHSRPIMNETRHHFQRKSVSLHFQTEVEGGFESGQA